MSISPESLFQLCYSPGVEQDPRDEQTPKNCTLVLLRYEDEACGEEDRIANLWPRWVVSGDEPSLEVSLVAKYFHPKCSGPQPG